VLLEDYMELEFQTICEDESISEIASLFLDMWRQCNEGDITLVKNALSREFMRHAVLEQSQGVDCDDDVMDDEICPADALKEEVSDVMDDAANNVSDGWELVTKGRRKSGRK